MHPRTPGAGDLPTVIGGPGGPRLGATGGDGARPCGRAVVVAAVVLVRLGGRGALPAATGGAAAARRRPPAPARRDLAHAVVVVVVVLVPVVVVVHVVLVRLDDTPVARGARACGANIVVARSSLRYTNERGNLRAIHAVGGLHVPPRDDVDLVVALRVPPRLLPALKSSSNCRHPNGITVAATSSLVAHICAPSIAQPASVPG